MRSFVLATLSLFIPLTPPAMAQRLPSGASPSHYSLLFSIDLEHDSFDGAEAIDLDISKPTKTITLNALDIKFGDVEVLAGDQTQTAVVSLDDKNEMATLTFANEVPVGRVELHIQYSGKMLENLRGLYVAKSNGRKYAVTQFEQVEARRAFPSFDEPAYKATFDIAAVIDKGDTAISNGVIVSDLPGPSAGKHTIKFATSPKMSTYLVALLVGDWKCANDEAEGVQLRICAVPGKENLTGFAMEVTKAALHYYANYFAVKYPLPKYDEIAVPDFDLGAMENWGAVTFRESVLLVDEKTASVDRKTLVTKVIAHEMAHQWFGNLVTFAWWDDSWLNEGFATWMSAKMLNSWRPEWGVANMISVVSDALDSDASPYVRPIHQEANTRSEIDAQFDSVAYRKGASVLATLENYLGPEKFREGLNLYLKEHLYGNAVAPDLWTALAIASNKPVDQIMKGFVLQPGAPYVSLKSRCEGGNTKIGLSQKRYFDSPSEFERPSEELWLVPMCVKTIDNGVRDEHQCFLLNKRQQEFSIPGCHQFTFPNADGLGYYRYDYDTHAIRKFGTSIGSMLTPDEQRSLVSNEFALVKMGRHSAGDFLDLGMQVRDTAPYRALDDFATDVEFIHRFMVTDADRPAFEARVSQIFSPLMKRIGYVPQANETPDTKQLRATVFGSLGMTANGPEATAFAKTAVQQYLNDPSSLDGDLAIVVLQVAAAHGDSTLYRQIRKEIKKNLSPEEYLRLLNALVNFPQSDLATQTLEWSVSDEVKGQYSRIPDWMLFNPAAMDTAWRFIQLHFPEIERKTGNGAEALRGFLSNATGNFCSPGYRKEAQEFLNQHPFPGTERNQKEFLHSIDACIELQQTQQARVSEWLRSSGTEMASH